MVTRAERALLQARKARAHERYVLRTYGLENGAYMEMLLQQDGRCAICMRVPRKRMLAVDHSHITGKVRALLCYTCNHEILGKIEGDPFAIYNLIQYLRNILEEEYENPK